MMEKGLFLIDANSLITPYLTYYPFDLVKTFWNQMEVHIKNGEVLRHIQDNPAYKPAALTEWSREEVADPWLIAAAAVGNYTIVSFENENKGLNTRNPSKNAKIPDVAKVFKVEVKSLYYMMRVLKFSL